MTLTAVQLVGRAAQSTVASLFAQQVQLGPARVAVEDERGSLSYAELSRRTGQLALALLARGVHAGDRIAVLAENRREHLELLVAVARIGAVLACQNWRLADVELEHCLSLVSPKLLVHSETHREKATAISAKLGLETLALGAEYEAVIAREQAPELKRELAILQAAVEPEMPLLILYTSGTTGLPKGAVISQRAQIFRNLVTRAEFGVLPQDTFVAWSPLYHMGAVDNSLGTLMTGGKVIVVAGFEPARLASVVAREPLGWLLLMPGMVGRFAEHLKLEQVVAKSVRVCGVMADLVPPAEIAEITRLLGAPYANTFGSTETGCPPCSSSLIPIGHAPLSLSKSQSPFCEVRLVNEAGLDVGMGEPGELLMRGPTLFSGYFNADETNRQDFREGWFHMGDVFVRNPDGTLDFVDRVKYLIKSGGENIYPAEIERVLLQVPGVLDAAVVRRKDPKWGEVPVAFVAHTGDVQETDLYARCRTQLAGYKQPKGIVFIANEEFPRSASGKIRRQELERLL